MASKDQGTVSKMTKSITCGSSGIRKYIIGAAVGVALFVVLRFGVGYVLRRNHTPNHPPNAEVIVNQDTSNDLTGRIAKEGEHISTLPDHILDQQPLIKELLLHAQTTKFNDLGILLSLNDTDLSNCHDCTSMYRLWLQERAENATRRCLLAQLRELRQNNVARKYEDYLKQQYKL